MTQGFLNKKYRGIHFYLARRILFLSSIYTKKNIKLNVFPVLSAWKRNRLVVDENLAKSEPVTFPYLQVNVIHQLLGCK